MSEFSTVDLVRNGLEVGFVTGARWVYDDLKEQVDQHYWAQVDFHVSAFLEKARRPADELEKIARARIRGPEPRVVRSVVWEDMQYRCVDGVLQASSTYHDCKPAWVELSEHSSLPIGDLDLLYNLKVNPNAE